MTFAQRRNRLTTHFAESIPAVKRHTSVKEQSKRGTVTLLWRSSGTLHELQQTT